MITPPTTPPNFNWRRLSSEDVVQALRVDRQTVSNWLRERCPCHRDVAGPSRPFFDLAEVLDWHKAKAVEQRPVAPGEDSPELERYRKLKADMTEFDLSVKKKKFMETAVIRAMVRKMAERTRIGFQSLGKRLSIKVAKESDPSAVERVIDGEVDKVLKDLATIRLDGLDDEVSTPSGDDDEKLELSTKEVIL